MTTVIAAPPSQIQLRVGGPAGSVSTVVFTINAASAGNGTPIVGVPNPLLVRVEAREAGCPAKNAGLFVTNPATLGGPSAIPYETISWTASDADIPAGTFLAGGGTQVMRIFPNCRQIENNHTFIFNNANVYSAGDNLGTVIYTLAMP